MSKASDEVGRSRERTQIKRSTRSVMNRANMLDQNARDLAEEALSLSRAHEALCNERWNNQNATMVRVEKTMAEVKVAFEDKIGRLPAGVIAGLTGLCGFLAARVIH